MTGSESGAVKSPLRTYDEGLAIPGKLTTSEIEKLRAALKRDNIDAGWLRSWLWRRGWRLPPPLFMAVSTDGAVGAAVFTLAFGALGFGRFFWMISFLLACLGGLITLRLLYKRRWASWRFALISILAIGFAAAVGIWAWSQLWQGPAEYSTELKQNGWLCLFYFGLTMFRHWNSHAERNLPRWRDYVAMTLAADAIA
jgi:hypothetical protein